MSTPSERTLAASIAAHESWAATEDRSARTAPARAALDRRFLEEAEGDPVRAASLRRAHFQRLALKSAKSRRRSRELAAEAASADAQIAEAIKPEPIPAPEPTLSERARALEGRAWSVADLDQLAAIVAELAERIEADR